MVKYLILIATSVNAVSTLGCSMHSSNASKPDVVFAATDVGKSTGPAVTKSIGPAGGSLDSADGRMTLTVPQNAVAEPVTFSVQPITSSGADAVGNAYRLGPSGHLFETPLEVAFKYEDSELEGTPPEFFIVTYQENDGSWRSLQTIYVDKESKTFTASTTHFSDIRFNRADRVGLTRLGDPKFDRTPAPPKPPEKLSLAQFRVSPEKATLYVGESLPIELTGCEHSNAAMKLLDRLLGFTEHCDWGNGTGSLWNNFILEPRGVGQVSQSHDAEHVVYTAPSKKPNPNVVRVICGGKFMSAGAPDFFARLGVTEVTILDRGYGASGQDGRASYSGVVCDLDKPFSVTITMGPLSFLTNFTPSSPKNGAASWAATYGATGSGGGPYTVTNEGDGYMILVRMNSTVRLAGKQSSGSGDVHIKLTPLTGNECAVPVVSNR